MRTSTVLAVLSVVLGGLACNSTTGVQNNFGAVLSDYYEVPADTSTGRATATFVVNGLTINYTLNITAAAASNYTAAHIHTGVTGVSGPVRVTLCGSSPACPTGTGTVAGTFTADSLNMPLGSPAPITYAALVTALRARGAYVNVHSATHTGGEIRGQIFPTEQ